EARERALNGGGSTLIEAMCTRMTAHSSDDDDTYRPQEERDALKSLDCNLQFKAFLLEEDIIDEKWLEAVEKEHKELINQATEATRKAPDPSAEETYTHVYGEGRLNNG